MAVWLREPLVYFLAVGAVLFLLTERLADRLDGDPALIIEVTDAERQRLSDQWQAQMGRPPSADELAGLVEQWIREEIYYREALALGLDADDVIIRRRLAQKLTFLTEDLATGQSPDEATLRAYYAEHAERYREPERFTFSHRYFSNDRRAQARADALAALQADAIEGDPFMLQRSYVARSQREIAELFGREFAAALGALPDGAWQGPVRSAYGWHLVRVEERHPARSPSFEEVARRVAADYRQQRRREANEAYYQSLRERYRVVGW
jgi:hypothetical protein